MSARKICVITGTRAEYGLLYWLLKELQSDSEIELQLMVTGSHLSEEFGSTYREIEGDGFAITQKIPILSSKSSEQSMGEAMGVALVGFSKTLAQLKPDVVVILGDRYEVLGAATAALLLGIPIAHIQGGELTEGAVDESLRHGLTKFSHIHFPATEHGRKLIIQLGEDPRHVFNVGSLSAENVKKTELRSREDLEKTAGIKLGKLNFLFTYHPVTTSNESPIKVLKDVLVALDEFPNAHIIMTKPGADTGGAEIMTCLEEYARKNSDRVFLKDSLGRVNYLSALKYCDVVIGNSSSGILEAPLFKKPTVNIGPRQQGRLRSSSILDCSEDTKSVVNSIKKALSPEFQKLLATVKSPYEQADTSRSIKEKLKTINLDELLVKRFHEI